MKKFLGLFMAVLSTIGIASAFHINAAEAPTASQFQNVETKARLKFSYNDETLALNSMQIKFGGQVSKEYFTEGENVEHGVIVTPTELVTLLSPTDHLLTLEKYDLLKQNEFLLDFTREEIKTVLNDKNEEVYQYNWVLNAIDKDQNLLPYNYTFVAAMYEKIGDVITLANPKIGSIVSVIDEYYALADFNPDTNLDTVLKSVRNQFKKYSVSENFLRNNQMASGGFPIENPDYTLYVHAWIGDDLYDNKHTLIKNINGIYDFYLENKYTDINFILGKPDVGFNWDNNHAKTHNMKLSNIGIFGTEYKTYDNLNSIIEKYFIIDQNKKVFAWVWKEGLNGYFVEVINGKITIPSDANRVIFIQTNNNNPEWDVWDNDKKISNVENRTMDLNLFTFEPILYNFRFATKWWANNDDTPVYVEIKYDDLEQPIEILCTRDKNTTDIIGDGNGSDYYTFELLGHSKIREIRVFRLYNGEKINYSDYAYDFDYNETPTINVK